MLRNRKYDHFNMRKKIKEMTGTDKKQSVGNLTNPDGMLVGEIEQKLRVWKEYVEKLFDDNRNSNHTLNMSNTGTKITKNEVSKSVASITNGKSSGPDNVNSNSFKATLRYRSRFREHLYRPLPSTKFTTQE